MDKIINLGILAHVDAGKTTVTEGLLVHCGVKQQMGRVDHGTTTTDSMALERQRGMTIRASTVSFHYKNTKINLLDTPGHMDFIAEVERSLSVLDGVVLVVSAREGVQPQTRVIFRKLQAMGIPTIIFVNKIDRVGVSIETVYAQMRAQLSEDIIAMQQVLHPGTRDAAVLPLALQADACECLIEQDAALMEQYLGDAPITHDMLMAALAGAIEACNAFPVFYGAALHDIGIGPLLDAVVRFFSQKRCRDSLSALVYKVEWDAAGRKRLYCRLFGGSIRVRDKVQVMGQETPVQVKGLMAAEDGQYRQTQVVQSGDIGILLDVQGISCGQWIGAPVPGLQRDNIAPPLLQVGIAPAAPQERPQLLEALKRLCEEDPYLAMHIHGDTGEISIRLFGALQLEVIESLLVERFGISAVFSPLQTRLAVKPKAPVQAEIRIYTTENPHAAGIALSLLPRPAGSGNSYETLVSFGHLTKTFQNGVEEGVMQGLATGLGHEIVDTHVAFTDMDFCSVNGTPAAYRRLAPMVIRKALAASGLVQLEPWLQFTATVPQDYHKRTLSALAEVQAVVLDVTFSQDEVILQGEVPVDTSKHFAAHLLSITQGKGFFQTEFLAYRNQR